jgi:hypothetical protein
MTSRYLKIAAAAALATAAGSALAQVIPVPIRPAYRFPEAPKAEGAASVQVGDTPLYFAPFIGFAAGHDDNLFLSRDNPKGSTLYITSPGFKLDARDSNKIFQLDYQGQVGRFAQSEDDDYVDHTARTAFDVAFTPRVFARLGYDYIRGHDPRGSTDRAFSPRPDIYRFQGPNATFAYGAPGADGRVEAYYSDTAKRYTNNRAVTIASDRDTREVGATIYARVMPRTYLLADVRRTTLSYTLPSSPFSGREDRLYGGVMWEPTAATTGTIKVGRFEKSFNSDLPRFSGTAWEALVTWAPRTYSKFDFYTGRSPAESTGLGSFILSEASGVIWSHAWTSYLTTEVNLRFQKDEYQNFNRSDDIRSLGLRAGYKFRRWLTLGAEYTYTQRDSNVRDFEFDKNIYLLTATLSM